MVRAKFRCVEKTSSTSNYGQEHTVQNEVVKLNALAGPGNEEWSKYTPSGEVRMTINNPAAMAQFEVGKDYFLDFTAAD